MGSRKLLKDSRVQVALVLTAVWLLAVWHDRTINSFLFPLLSVLTVACLDLAITKIRAKIWFLSASSVVSGLLIGLIIAPAGEVWVILIAALFASLSKQFIGAGVRRHIFNPAAFGIMAVNFAFGTPIAWWGVAWSRLPLLVLVPAMIWILWRLKRQFIPLTFVAVYFVYLLTLMTPSGALKTLVDGSVMLFVLVMLPEPITSPNWGYFKYLFGALAAVLAIALPKFLLVSDNFLAALLLGNLIGFLWIWLPKTFSKTETP